MLNIPASHVGNAIPERRDERLDLRKLTESAAAGLVPMFNRERGLYCDRLLLSESGLKRKGLSHRYTMMTLLGLQRYRETGMSCPISPTSVLDGMLRDTAWAGDIGDLGLLLWTCAMVWPGRLQEVRQRMTIDGALGRYRDAAEGRTMEVAWFLAGLSHMAIAQPETAAGLRGIAFAAAKLLLRNQGGHGIFGHLSRRGSLSGMLRGGAGSFADQVYPIYALSKFGVAYRQSSALAAARRCVQAICREQGSLGQWWWHYGSRDGRVLEHYPVFSVHQHAMGPMALFAMEDATGVDLSEPIYRGLRWVYGKNELSQDMRGPSGVIWRNFYHASLGGVYRDRLRGVLKPGSAGVTNDLAVNRECRPYELGWLLYAFAGRTCPAM